MRGIHSRDAGRRSERSVKTRKSKLAFAMLSRTTIGTTSLLSTHRDKGCVGPQRTHRIKQKDQPTKTCFKDLFHMPVLLAALGLILAGRVTAQTFKTLHH